MSKTAVILFVLIFSMGWVANSLLGSLFVYTPERPVPVSFLGFNQSFERSSPSDHIKRSQIHVYQDSITLDIEGAMWAEFTNTNSMDPVLDEYSHGIEIMPQSHKDIEVGDVISYKSKFAEGIIIHRVVSKGADSEGIYFILKGDNNPTNDPGKVRFEQVKGLLVGILY